LLMIIILLLFSKLYSQNIYLDSTTTYIEPSVAPVGPGDTIFLEAGHYDYLFIKNIRGQQDSPVTITNYNGEVIINNNHYFGVSFNFCEHIHFTGQKKYGIRILGVSNGAGIGISNLSNFFEIDHVEIAHTKIAGIMCKTEPGCSFTATRDSFLMEDIHIHHNYIHHTGTEGMYIGSSSFTGKVVNCNGKDTLLMPHVIVGVHIHDNLIRYTGWDGLQVSSALSDCHIYNNRIFYDSQEGHNFQMSGILNGGGSACDCYNNLIAYGKGNGIEFFGTGSQRIFNNIIVEPGKTYKPGEPNIAKHGIYLGKRAILPPDSSFAILNNTIIRPKSDGIRFNIDSVYSTGNRIQNNIIIDPGAYDYYDSLNTYHGPEDAYVFELDTSLIINISHNIFTRNIDYLKFTNVDSLNFTLLNNSPAIDSGINLDNDSIYYDFFYDPRPIGLGYDAGAFEYNYANVNTKVKASESFILFPNPAENQVFIQHNKKPVTISLISPTGIVLSTLKAVRSGQAISIANLKPGIYFVIIQTDSGKQNMKKLIVI
ncbi:MAG: T9SS type A sorting domain-containing protein, partial [Bacteroidales bacterium]|nr:T9SS type A sorting domain-containing protein [Bacteroidales bacterium]